MPDPLFDGQKLEEKTSVVQQINYRLGFNAFSRFRLNGLPVCMIPSRGMMQCYLQATRGKNAPTLVPRFGLSPWKGLLAGMKEGKRDGFQSFKPLDEKTPSVVDTFPALQETADADIHDFYHAVRWADVPEKEVKLFAKCADALYGFTTEPIWQKQLISTNYVLGTFWNCQEAVKHIKPEDGCETSAEGLAEIIIDMEHISYDRRLSSELFQELFNEGKIKSSSRDFEKFWYSIGLSASRRMIPENEFMPLLKKLGNWLLQHENELEREYGLTLQTLLNIPSQELGFITGLKSYIQQYQEENLPSDIQKLNAMAQPTSGHGRYMREGALAKMEKLVSEDFPKAVNQLLELKSSFLKTICYRVLANNLEILVETGELTKAISQNPRAFTYLVTQLRANEFYDRVIDKLLNLRVTPLDLFKWLYHPSLVNQVFASDRQTFLQRALKTEKFDIIWILVNDGANSRKVVGSEGPTPYELAQLSGCPGLNHLLICAEICGPGWLSREKELVQRLKDLLNRNDYTEKDKQWLEVLTRMVKPLPQAQLKEDPKEILKAFKGFLNAIDSTGVAMENETLDWFGAMKVWADKGGTIPDLSIPLQVKAILSKQNAEPTR